jgi:hypothetical protein
MPETRGYETINDRTDGWGPGVDAEAQPDADASAEAVATRLARLRKARKDAEAGVNSDIADRTEGAGGAFDATAGADDGYGVKAWEESPLDVGANRDLDVATGSNTALGTSDSEATVTGRTATALPTSDLVPDTYERVETVGSIVDRTEGWGHASGTQNDRKD